MNDPVKGGTDLHLSAARVWDLIILRRWKNNASEAFFHQEKISLGQQILWFAKYLKRKEDTITMIWSHKSKIGCIGVRWKGGAWDVYNVILGDQRFAGKGLMSRAMDEILQQVLNNRDAPVRLKVLIENPAVEWYLKRGFEVVGSTEKAHIMQLTTANSQGNAQERFLGEGPIVRVEE